jgi:outer membrane biosynthesis protein TonB
MKNRFYILIISIAVTAAAGLSVPAQSTKKALVVNGEQVKRPTEERQNNERVAETILTPIRTEQEKPQQQVTPTENVVQVKTVSETEKPVLEKPPTVPTPTPTPTTDKRASKTKPTFESKLQINGKQNKYGGDDIDDNDLASLKDLEINNSASFFINGGDGDYKETEAPQESELATTAQKEAANKNGLTAAVVPNANQQVVSGDLMNIALGRVSPRTKKVITTTTYTTVVLPGNVPVTSVNPGRMLGVARGITPQIAGWIMYYGRQYGVDPLLILEVMRQESQFKPYARSPVGAAGLMQFMPGTAARFGINPLDPEQAIRGGAQYLSFLLRRYGGNVFSALAGYNAGEGAVDCFLTGRSLRLSNGKIINRGGMRTMHGVPPYAETQNYVKVISTNYFNARQTFK